MQRRVQSLSALPSTPTKSQLSKFLFCQCVLGQNTKQHAAWVDVNKIPLSLQSSHLLAAMATEQQYSDFVINDAS